MDSKIRDEILEMKQNVSQHIIGQEDIIERLIIALLVNGNLLVEGLPGLAKTRSIKALASHIDGEYGRIQFTPDLQSTDITGREVFYGNADGEGRFRFEQGPIFANIVLADEINRAPSKVQNSLLEAMEERQVTVSGTAHKLPPLFMVMATQNPVEQAGTYALPEAQMDRFVMHVTVDYPSQEAEADIIRLVRREEAAARQKEKAKEWGEVAEEKPAKKEKKKPDHVVSQATIFAAREELDHIKVSQDIENYIVKIVFATRYPRDYSYTLKSYIKTGVSPRGSLALDRTARAHAWLRGRDRVIQEDVLAIVKPVLRHRVARSDKAIEHKVTTDDIIDHILEEISFPVEDGVPVSAEG